MCGKETCRRCDTGTISAVYRPHHKQVGYSTVPMLRQEQATPILSNNAAFPQVSSSLILDLNLLV
jgi:hypothetical protein